jgi:hypothetical protein
MTMKTATTKVTKDNVLDLFACDYLYALAADQIAEISEAGVLVSRAVEWVERHDGYSLDRSDAAEILNSFRNS